MYFVNPNKVKCGVYQIGLQIFEVIKTIGFEYTEDLNLPKNSIYVFNNHPGTNLSAVNKDFLDKLGGKSIGFVHDPYHYFDFFDAKIRLDPTFHDSPPYYGIGRIIKNYNFAGQIDNNFRVGSWGFGLGHKNYQQFINLVESQLKNAIIRLHIPFSDWCDSDGNQAKATANYCRSLVKNNQIEISHEYMEQIDFLKWANLNDVNVFTCDEGLTAGVSSCVDWALMSKKGIGVNRCMMYKNVYDEKTCIYRNSLVDLAQNYDYLQKYRDLWSPQHFKDKFECILKTVLH